MQVPKVAVRNGLRLSAGDSSAALYWGTELSTQRKSSRPYKRLPPLTNCVGDTEHGTRDVFVLPHPNNLPTGVRELLVSLAITVLIHSNLVRPVIGVRPRRFAVRGAAVPEATIHEYCDASRPEDDIRCASERRHGPSADAKSETCCVQR